MKVMSIDSKINTHNYHPILFHFTGKGSLTKALQIFVPVCSNHLALATANPCALFANIHQKFSQRRKGNNCEC